MSIEAKLTETRGDDASLSSKADIAEQERADGDEPSEAQIRRIVHKIDRRLIPMSGLLVAISLLDRANLSNAVIAG